MTSLPPGNLSIQLNRYGKRDSLPLLPTRQDDQYAQARIQMSIEAGTESMKLLEAAIIGKREGNFDQCVDSYEQAAAKLEQAIRLGSREGDDASMTPERRLSGPNMTMASVDGEEARLQSLQKTLVKCYREHAKALMTKGEELFRSAHESHDTMMQAAMRAKANSHFSSAVAKFDLAFNKGKLIYKKALENIDWNATDEKKKVEKEQQQLGAIALDLGRALSVRAANKAQEAESAIGPQEKRSREHDALVLYDLACRRLRECHELSASNYAALRLWGMCLWRQSEITRAQHQREGKREGEEGTENANDKLVEAGRKLLMAFKLNSTSDLNRDALVEFFHQNGLRFNKLADQSGAEELSRRVSCWSQAHQLFRKGLEVAGTSPPASLLRDYGELVALLSTCCLPEMATYFKQQATESIAMAKWIDSADYTKRKASLLKFGFVSKQGSILSTWNRRFIILEKDKFEILKSVNGKSQVIVERKDLRSIDLLFDEERDYRFNVQARDTQEIHFAADEEKDRLQWVQELRWMMRGELTNQKNDDDIIAQLSYLRPPAS